MSLCLIHTADRHGRLRADQAQRLGDLKRERGALLLDAGDALCAPNLFAFPWPEPVIARMNAAGYDALCVGNREYALTRRGLVAKLGGLACPVLSANLLPRREPLPCLQRWTVLTAADGTRVGVFGLSQPIIEPGSFWERHAAARYVPPESVVPEAIAALRPQVDLLVVLTHYGDRPEAALAAAHPELDLILAGHWHAAEPSLETVGAVTISRTFPHGRGAAILTLVGGHWEQESYAP
jgi:2',3'-cyclic-nucleotide 2'-phosphodiesterase (5'-nucleotidase family)